MLVCVVYVVLIAFDFHMCVCVFLSLCVCPSPSVFVYFYVTLWGPCVCVCVCISESVCVCPCVCFYGQNNASMYFSEASSSPQSLWEIEIYFCIIVSLILWRYLVDIFCAFIFKGYSVDIFVCFYLWIERYFHNFQQWIYSRCWRYNVWCMNFLVFCILWYFMIFNRLHCFWCSILFWR